MAGASPRSDEGKKKARIEIIPLIDVIFFLLATFVLFTLSLDKIQSIPLQLPVAQPMAQNQKPDDDMVTLQVSDEGSYFWNKEPIQSNEIRPKIDQLKRTVQTPRIFLTCDDKAKFKSAVYALDQIRLAGIQQFSVDTRGPRPTGR